MIIVTASDDNYVAGVMVLVQSAALHNPEAEFVILDNGIKAENLGRLTEIGRRLGTKIRIFNTSESEILKLPTSRSHLNATTYLRLAIPDLLPEADRVLYMDCDMVVCDSLTEIASLDLGDNLVAAVPCACPDPKELESTGTSFGTYFNAGLLLINVAAWRRERLSVAAMRLAQEGNLICEDQSAVNILCKGRVAYLPSRYNVYSSIGGHCEAPERTLVADPAVIHYIVNRKPWMRSGTMTEIWQAYRAPIADLVPVRNAATPKTGFVARLEELNLRRKLWMGSLSSKREKKIRARNWHFMRDVIEPAALAKARAVQPRG